MPRSVRESHQAPVRFGRYVHTVETIADTEVNLTYCIQIGRRRRRYYWRVEAEREGPSRRGDAPNPLPIVSIAITTPDGEETVLTTDDLPIGVGGDGGPCASRDEALSEALQLVETIR